jgi:hypothetical protein
VTNGTAITPIVFTWGGDATDATVTGLPASGITFVKDVTAQTITISGTPTATVSYSVATSGAVGTPATGSGTITVTTPVNMIQNFTTSGATSTFFTISGNMNSTDGSVTYAGLTLTKRLKIESSTSITFTTTQAGTLTLVFDATFTGTIKVNLISYTAVAGIVTVAIPAGSNTITKGSTANLFYVSVAYSTITGIPSAEASALKLYPNPVINSLFISSGAVVEKVDVYSLTGVLVKQTIGNVKTIDMSNLSKGSYLVNVYTNQGVCKQKMIKE